MSRINTNVTSLLAARVLNNNNASVSRSLERLSTGLRINAGKDDPAGLIASESLRSEAVAVQAAIDNANRASTVVGVAEGALNEVNSLLLSLEELVDRSASEAGLSPDETKANQAQIDSILDSINRIANTTEFNGKKLLDGSMGYTTSGVDNTSLGSVQITAAKLPDGGTKNVVVEVTASAAKAELIYTTASTIASAVTIQVAGNLGSDQFSFAASTNVSAIAAAINQSTELTGVEATVTSGDLHLTSKEYGSDQFVSVEAIAGTFAVEDVNATVATRNAGADAGVTVNGTVAHVDGLTAEVRSGSLSGKIILTEALGTALSSSSFTITGGGANFAISPTLGLAGRESIGIDSVATGSLGDAVTGFLSTLGSGQANALDTDNMATAQRIIRNTIDQVTTLRGRLGGFQKNTIETTINSLQVAFENLQAADSAIRDTDFAQETSRLTRSQILVQSATQALQLANAAPGAVLSLLR